MTKLIPCNVCGETIARLARVLPTLRRKAEEA